MLSFMRNEHADTLSEIRNTGKFEDSTRDAVKSALDTFAKQFA